MMMCFPASAARIANSWCSAGGTQMIDHINVFPGQQRIEVVGGKRDPEFLRKRVGAFLGSGANRPDLHDVAGQLGVIRKMHPRPVTRAHQTNCRESSFVPGHLHIIRPGCTILFWLYEQDEERLFLEADSQLQPNV
jgi:hypothetical protein